MTATPAVTGKHDNEKLQKVRSFRQTLRPERSRDLQPRQHCSCRLVR